MIWLVRDFDLLSVLLRALSFALEALAFGGVFFLLFVARPAMLPPEVQARVRRNSSWFALAMGLTQLLLLAATSIVLLGGSGMALRNLLSAPFFLAGSTFFAASLALFACLRITPKVAPSIIAAIIALGGSVSLSHAVSRLDHRPLLIVFTAVHHLGMAAWIGGLLCLLSALRLSLDLEISRRMARRFSAMAIVSVAALILAGIGLSLFYVGSWQGLYGTSYGILLSAKIVLTALALVVGAGNFFLVRGEAPNPVPLLFSLRRFSEAELGIAFTVILAAASLTAQSPAIDETPQDTVTAHEILQRMEWRSPSFRSPALAQLAPPTPLGIAVREATFTGGSASDANDRAWSEYNHHWAGLIVLAAGLLTLVSRLPRQRWARHWPLLFLALSVFILLRADPECWPLGPRSFWPSFTAPDVLEHRAFAALIAAFSLFEWGVQTGRLHWRRARFVFPALCAAGAAFLLTHTHALGEGTDEVFAEFTHTPIAILGAGAGWSRWLEMRLAADSATARNSRASRIAAWIWPVCIILIGLLLLNYRES